MASVDFQTYAIGDGGLLRHVERVLRITRDDRRDLVRRIQVVIALAYVPFLAVGIAWRITHGDWAPSMEALMPHVRALVTLPLLLVAEAAIEERAGAAGRYLSRSRILEPDCLEGHRSAIARIARLRDSPFVEAALVAGTVASLFLMPQSTRAPERVLVWSMQPAVFLFRFLAFRMLWRWYAWSLYLLRLSRLPLHLRATHPDRTGGLEPLAGPSVMFGAFVMAVASSVSASWADRMRFEGVEATRFSRDAVALVIVSLVVAGAPLWSFTGRLITLRKQGVHAFGAFANRYVDAFERRWFDESGEKAQGAAAIQSLNDLGGSFERVQQMSIVVAPRAMLSAVVACAVLPMLPLAIAHVGAAELLARLARALL